MAWKVQHSLPFDGPARMEWADLSVGLMIGFRSDWSACRKDLQSMSSVAQRLENLKLAERSHRRRYLSKWVRSDQIHWAASHLHLRRRDLIAYLEALQPQSSVYQRVTLWSADWALSW